MKHHELCHFECVHCVALCFVHAVFLLVSGLFGAVDDALGRDRARSTLLCGLVSLNVILSDAQLRPSIFVGVFALRL